MILSSADILGILGGSEIVRLSAKLKISDGKPKLSGAEGLFIYIDRFPRVDEFQATWFIYIESDGSEPDDIVLGELKRLLPNVKVKEGLLLEVTTTDFLTESTQKAPVAPVVAQDSSPSIDYEERFQNLLEDVQDQMLLINSGRDGRDGIDGRSGADGRDGKDLLATEADLEDLNNVEEGVVKEKGQVLTWDGTRWTNLFIPQFTTPGAASNGGGGDSGGGGGDGSGQINSDTIVSETVPTEREDNKGPLRDGDSWFKVSNRNFYVYNEGVWYLISGGSSGGGGGGGGWGQCDGILDGGNSDNGISNGVDNNGSGILDGGNADTGASSGVEGGSSGILDGGDADSGISSGIECDEGGGGAAFPEAPIDGKQYARQDAEWTEVAAGGIEEAPLDGNYYVRHNGSWIDLASALFAMNDTTTDGGNFTTGESSGTDESIDGGEFS